MSSVLNNSSKLVSNIYISRKNLLKQLDYQNYNILEYDTFSMNEMNAMYINNQLDMILEKKDKETNNKKIYVKYYLRKILKTNNVQEMIDEIFNLERILTNHDTLYIVVKEEVNDTMTNLLKYIYDKYNIFIIIQNITRLQFNILEHTLVPKHIILNETEIEDVKKKHNITNNIEFPKISRFDPVAIAIGIRPSEICKILRPSKTTITNTYYRICENY
jgi:DNA-directed RNA polymerase subunit H (RpoH/RPB5)